MWYGFRFVRRLDRTEMGLRCERGLECRTVQQSEIAQGKLARNPWQIR